MSRAKVVVALSVASALILALAGNAISQWRGPTTPEQKKQFSTQMTQQWKEPLGATDEEWKVLEPKIAEYLIQKNNYAFDSSINLAWITSADYKLPSESLPDGEKTDLQKKVAALRKLLLDKNTAPEDIKTALAEYRASRDKAKKDLEKAKKDLRDLLTVRQEALMVLGGQFE